MLTTKHLKVHLKDYTSCRGGSESCTFYDEKGDCIEIESQTLYYMFRFMKRELEMTDEWDTFQKKALEPFEGMARIIEE